MAAALPLAQRVGQLIVMSFAGASVPGYVHDIFAARKAAGAILFGSNATSAHQVRSLTRRLQHDAHGAALIGADQEGGDVRIMKFAGPGPGQATQATPVAAAAAARGAARDLRHLGLNVNFAPVVDVASAGSAFYGRTFPGDARNVARLARAAIGAYRHGGVAPTAKHFPGLGAASANTDDQPVTIRAPASVMRTRDLVPFRAAIAAGVPLIMAGHAVYPAFDAHHIASQSPTLLRTVLRGRLHYHGAIITDSEEARAVLARSSVSQAALRSIRAGCDLVLLTGPGSYSKVYPTLLRTARRSAAFRARVTDAATRVIALKRGLGLHVRPASVR